MAERQLTQSGSIVVVLPKQASQRPNEDGSFFFHAGKRREQDDPVYLNVPGCKIQRGRRAKRLTHCSQPRLQHFELGFKPFSQSEQGSVSSGPRSYKHAPDAPKRPGNPALGT